MYSVSEFRYYASLSRTEQRAIADAEIDNTEERETVTPMRFQLSCYDAEREQAADSSAFRL
jgi:hypothetical protein